MGSCQFDWDTHQIKNENRGRISCQWRATCLRVAELPVDYKDGERSNLIA